MFIFDDMTKEELEDELKEVKKEWKAEEKSKKLGNDKERITQKIKEFFRNFNVNSICSICQDSGFYIHLGEEVPFGLNCMRDGKERKFVCMSHSGFNMKAKLDWFKFRVANSNTGFWEYYRTAKYEQGEGVFEDLDEVEVTNR